MTRMSEIVNILINDYGYNAKYIEVNKNGIKKAAVELDNGESIHKVIYIEDIEECGTAADYADAIDERYRTSADLEINTDEILSEDYIRENIYLCVCRVTDDDVTWKKTICGDIEVYLRVKVGDTGSYKVSKELYNKYDNLGFNAIYNTNKDLRIKDCFGLDILTNAAGFYGAAGAFVCVEKLKEYCDRHSVPACVIIPSSINEVILMPYDNDIDREWINTMVREINDAEVAPEEQLSDHAYLYSVAEDEIKEF